jgi:enoyl-CoA hydratase
MAVFDLSITDHVATLTLDRPDALNAMGPAFFEELPERMAEINDTDAVRVVIFQGKGRAFSAGLDLKQMGPEILSPNADASPAERRRALRDLIQTMQDALSSVADCRVPVIAAIHGACIGGGIDLITACDIRLAADDARFSIRETRMAMVADLGTLQRIRDIVPEGHVAELVYTGKDIPAGRAAEIGLVNRVLDDREMLQDAAREMAEQIASNSPLAVEGAKHVLRASRDQSVEEGLDYVALWNTAFLPSEDLSEAVHAFVEGRDPSFEGR